MSEHRDAPRAATRRAAILSVAWAVFREHGYGGGSMSLIAERLGGSKGTLYKYFASKEELLLAVARTKGEELYLKFQDLPVPESPIRKLLSNTSTL